MFQINTATWQQNNDTCYMLTMYQHNSAIMSVLFSVFVLNDSNKKPPIKQCIRVLFLVRNNDAQTWKFIILWQKRH